MLLLSSLPPPPSLPPTDNFAGFLHPNVPKHVKDRFLDSTTGLLVTPRSIEELVELLRWLLVSLWLTLFSGGTGHPSMEGGVCTGVSIGFGGVVGWWR